jgi:hypothetical protein
MDEAVARFTVACAEQTERDHDALVKAAKAKRVKVARTARRPTHAQADDEHLEWGRET